MKALEIQEEEEKQGDRELKNKMLYLANIMQYEDDFDDQNFYVNKNRKRKETEGSSSSDEAP